MTTFNGSSSATAPGDGQGAAWALSSANRTASFTPSGVTAQVTSTGALSSGKWYWEILANAIGSGGVAGIVKSGDDINTFLGHSANGYGYSSTDGHLYNNNVTTTAYGSTYTASDVIGVAYDATNGNLWFSKNGTWQNSATIAEINAGTTTHAAKTGLSGTFYPSVANSSSSGAAVTWSLQVATATLTFTVPTGYRPLDATAFSLTMSPLSYAFSLAAATTAFAHKFTMVPLSYSLTLIPAAVGRYYKLVAAPLSFAFTLKATILAYFPVASSAIRKGGAVLQKLRTTDPTLDS